MMKSGMPASIGVFTLSCDYTMSDNSSASTSENPGTGRKVDDPLVGSVVADRYLILSKLGAGGMCVVYKAKHQFMNRTVALKMLHSRLLDNTSSVKRFQQEAEAISLLSHANLVTAFDFGVLPEGQPYLVMDCADGSSLAEFINQHDNLPVERAVPIFIQIAGAISHAHHKGVMHRDLKPSNIILSKAEDGTDQAKVVDFGIATFLPESGLTREKLTQTGEFFGSCEYMSPEQCRGMKVDPRADIYSLGCVMYEALSGLAPFTGDNPFEIFQKHINEEALPFSRVRRDLHVPAPLENMILKALSKEPEDRYQSMEQLKLDLALFEDAYKADPALLVPLADTTPFTVTSDEPKRRSMVAEIMAMLVAVMALAIILNWDSVTSVFSGGREAAQWAKFDRAGQHAFDAGKYTEAETQFRLAVEQAERLGEHDQRLVISLRKLGDVLSAEGKFDQAKTQNQRIEKITAPAKKMPSRQ
jgi:serine/threonine protein kinase